uniref:Uncharacterized protein n=1 Tax=Arundo donax TaxID=35708 RepID=A0A0A9GAJ7_ARUDO
MLEKRQLTWPIQGKMNLNLVHKKDDLARALCQAYVAPLSQTQEGNCIFYLPGGGEGRTASFLCLPQERRLAQ